MNVSAVAAPRAAASPRRCRDDDAPPRRTAPRTTPPRRGTSFRRAGRRRRLHAELDRPDRALRGADARSGTTSPPPTSRRYFKPETLGLAPGDRAVRVERPRAGVTVTRDRWGVPHVKGRTAEDVAFGAGWATAADRQVLLELLRGPGRLAALDAPGLEPFAFALSGRTFRSSPQTRPCSPGSSTSSAPAARRACGRSGSSTRTSPGSTRSTGPPGSRYAAGRGTTSSRSARWSARSSARAAETRCVARSSWTRSSAARAGAGEARLGGPAATE